MTSDLLASTAGVVLSLLFSYIPKFSSWYDALEGDTKRLIMLASLFVTAAGIFGVGCTGLFDVQVSCDLGGALGLLKVFIVAAVANQTAYKLSPRS